MEHISVPSRRNFSVAMFAETTVRSECLVGFNRTVTVQ